MDLGNPWVTVPPSPLSIEEISMANYAIIYSGGMGMGAMPEMYNLVVNTNHPVIGQIIAAKTKKRKEKLTKQVVDLALLGQGLLKGEELTKFIRRSVDLIK